MSQKQSVSKESKEKKAFRLVAQTHAMINESNEKFESCERLFQKNLDEYAKAKKSLHNNGLDGCVSLLSDLNYHEKPKEVEEIVIFETPNKEHQLKVKDISKGRIGALFWSLIGGLVMGISLVYLATEKMGMTLNVTQIPNSDTLQSIFSWFSISIGREPDAWLGFGIFMVVVSMIVMSIYFGYRTIKRNKNLHFSVKQFVETELYIEENENCEESMNRVDNHIQSSIKTLKLYEVMLCEQEGKLKRIFYIEGEKDKSIQYNEKSLYEIRDTKILIDAIIEFISFPMSKNGKISEESLSLLEETNKKVNILIDRIYS